MNHSKPIQGGPEAKKRPGRPQKLTAALQDTIVLIIRSGAYVETAAAMAGISKDSFYEWLKRGKEEKSGMYRQFSDAVQKAMAEAEVRDVLVIDRAAQGRPVEYLKDKQGNLVLKKGEPQMLRPAVKPEWQAAAWRLERKFPKRWGRTDKLKLEGLGDMPQVIINLPLNGREAKE